MKMSKSYRYSVFFFLIFLVGVLGFVAYINRTLNKKTEIILPHPISTGLEKQLSPSTNSVYLIGKSFAMQSYTCIAIYTYPHECAILKLELESAGIRHYFQNETLVGLFPMSSLAFGGIRLMVHPAHISRAKEIIDSRNDKSSHLRIV